MALDGFKDGKVGDGLHKMASGFTHTADSLAGGPRGTFNSHFGAPGDPTRKASPSADAGIAGKISVPSQYPKKGKGGK